MAKVVDLANGVGFRCHTFFSMVSATERFALEGD